MKKICLLFLFIQINCAFAQYKKIIATAHSIENITEERFLGKDKFGFNYFITDNTFIKKNATVTLEYKNVPLGKIAKVDLENPLKIILFYENFNTVVTLDNQLNETQKVNFSEIEKPIVVNAVGLASQNRFWIYDNLTQQLGLYDYLNGDYTVLTQSFQGNLKYYQSDFNYFIWIDEKNNGYTCDVFGKITKLESLPVFDSIQIMSIDLFIYSKEQKLYLQDLKTQTIFVIENINKSFKSFSYKEQILSIFTTEGITNYKITIQ